jgi:hypothetical protein
VVILLGFALKVEAILTFKWPIFACANKWKQQPRISFYIFRQQGNLLHFLFSTKCCLFQNFIFLCSNNIFLINHALKFKYQPSHLKVNVDWYRCSITVFPSP